MSNKIELIANEYLNYYEYLDFQDIQIEKGVFEKVYYNNWKNIDMVTVIYKSQKYYMTLKFYKLEIE